ncbi:MAG: phosphatase PAP2 family protein [Ostreibacterium sp.]
MTNKVIFKQLVICSLLSIVILAILHYTSIDRQVQNWLYDFDKHQWIIYQNQLLHNLLYIGPRKTLIVFGLVILFCIIFSFTQKGLKLKSYCSGLNIVFFSIILVTSSVGGLKFLTDRPCPRDFSIYNGKIPYYQLLSERHSENTKRYRCFPAGHASGGFALLSLYFLFKGLGKKRIGLILGLTTGWVTGLYKMMIGDHFIGDTVMSMLVAWMVILFIVAVSNLWDQYRMGRQLKYQVVAG